MKNKKCKAVVILLVLATILSGCGAKYTCSDCGKKVGKAYYDPFRSDTYYCEDCARDYFSPLPYSAYQVK